MMSVGQWSSLEPTFVVSTMKISNFQIGHLTNFTNVNGTLYLSYFLVNQTKKQMENQGNVNMGFC
jgi:hypothetical protein